MKIKLVETEKKLTSEQLQKTEKTIGLQLPDEYRRFVLLYNGGCPKPGGFRFICQATGSWEESLVAWFLAIYEGEAENFLKFFNDYQGRIPADTIAIARDPGGNLILLGTVGKQRGKIFFWQQDFETDEDDVADYSNVCWVADSFNDFINSLF